MRNYVAWLAGLEELATAPPPPDVEAWFQREVLEPARDNLPAMDKSDPRVAR